MGGSAAAPPSKHMAGLEGDLFLEYLGGKGGGRGWSNTMRHLALDELPLDEGVGVPSAVNAQLGVVACGTGAEVLQAAGSAADL